MFSDLLPASLIRLWWLARRALLLASLAFLVGAAAVVTGRPVEQPPQLQPQQFQLDPLRLPLLSDVESQPISCSDTATASEELLHDVEPVEHVDAAPGSDDHVLPNIVIPETVEPLPAPRVIWMEVTAYCACKKCCGPNAQGITASGKRVSYNDGKFVAADTSVLPFGTKLLIPGYHGEPVEVIDRGGAIKGNKLDVFYASHDEALIWGRQSIPVTVVD